MTNSKCPLIKTCFAPRFNNICKPTIKSLYFASLLEHKGWILKRICTGVLFGEIKTTPIPTLFTCFVVGPPNLKLDNP